MSSLNTIQLVSQMYNLQKKVDKSCSTLCKVTERWQEIGASWTLTFTTPRSWYQAWKGVDVGAGDVDIHRELEEPCMIEWEMENRSKWKKKVSEVIKGVVLEWFRSYLSDRGFSVSLCDSAFSSAPHPCGVPRVLILGPILFSISMLPLGSILRKFGIYFHCYANKTHIYLPLKWNDATL